MSMHQQDPEAGQDHWQVERVQEGRDGRGGPRRQERQEEADRPPVCPTDSRHARMLLDRTPGTTHLHETASLTCKVEI